LLLLVQPATATPALVTGNLHVRAGPSVRYPVIPGIPGGAAWVALKVTKSPKEVGMFLDFMAQEANYAEFSSKTNNIPAHAGLAKKGVAYPTATPGARAALGVFSGGVSNLSPVAYQFQGYKYNRALFNPTAARLGQAIAASVVPTVPNRRNGGWDPQRLGD
jgi:ABC-type glycerol-3-phosphate transport system substrate-binding protein